MAGAQYNSGTSQRIIKTQCGRVSGSSSDAERLSVQLLQLFVLSSIQR